MSRGSVHILLRSLVIKPYRPHQLHADDDPDKRMEFCDRFLIIHEAFPGIYEEDSLDRWSNIRNKWKNKLTHVCLLEWRKPHGVIKEELNIPLVVAVWTSSWGRSCWLASSFFSFPPHPRHCLQLPRTSSYHSDAGDLRRVVWQHDGAPPHFGSNARRESVQIRPRSKDITFHDFSMWHTSTIKQQINPYMQPLRFSTEAVKT